MLFPASTLTLLRRDPFAMVRRIGGDFMEGSQRFPAINLWQSEDSATITAELPGVEAGDIDISVKDDLLAFSGERRSEEVDDKARWHRRERAWGKFSRAVRVPFNVDPDRTEARMNNGVLEVTVHRREEDKPQRIQVQAA